MKWMTMNKTIWREEKTVDKIDLKEKRKMSTKVVFNADESVLRQWEQVCPVVFSHHWKLVEC